jgi:peptide/nickel transport system substrate-binding protein
MTRWVRGIGAVVALLILFGISSIALAQKTGGVLRVYHRDSPASMSIHEEGTNSTEIPMMGVFNNLVIYDQHIAQNSLSTIRPSLPTAGHGARTGPA